MNSLFSDGSLGAERVQNLAFSKAKTVLITYLWVPVRKKKHLAQLKRKRKAAIISFSSKYCLVKRKVSHFKPWLLAGPVVSLSS